MRRGLLLACWVVTLGGAMWSEARANVRLASIFADNMVLQR